MQYLIIKILITTYISIVYKLIFLVDLSDLINLKNNLVQNLKSTLKNKIGLN